MNNATGQKGTKRYDISDQGQESSGLVTPSASSTSSWPSPLPLSPVMQRKSQRPLVFPSNSPSPERISGEQYDAAVLVMNFAFNPVVISTPVPAGGEENVPSPIGEVDTGGKKKWKKGEKPVLNGPTGILKICGTAGCTYQTKRGDHMRRHKMNMHSVGLKWHYCKLGDCVYKCKRKEALQRHQASMHDESKWHSCPLCSFKNKAKKGIKAHMKAGHTGARVSAKNTLEPDGEEPASKGVR